MIAFEPLYDRILVQTLEETRSIGGFILPESAKQDNKVGIVSAVGEGYVSETGEVRPLRLAKGDKIVFGPYAGIETQIAGVNFRIMREAEVVGRLTGAPDEPSAD